MYVDSVQGCGPEDFVLLTGDCQRALRLTGHLTTINEFPRQAAPPSGLLSVIARAIPIDHDDGLVSDDPGVVQRVLAGMLPAAPKFTKGLRQA